MNAEKKAQRLRATATAILGSQTYDQEEWTRRKVGEACGTPCCIAGHAAAFALKKGVRFGDYGVLYAADGAQLAESAADLAEEFLGLSEVEADAIFSASPEEDWPGTFARRWKATFRIDDAVVLRQTRAKIAHDYLHHLADRVEEMA